MEHGGGGSKAAAPIASKILLEAVKLDTSLHGIKPERATTSLRSKVN